MGLSLSAGSQLLRRYPSSVGQGVRGGLVLGVAALIFATLPSLASADGPVRFAMVIGNSDYDMNHRIDPAHSRAAAAGFHFAPDLSAPAKDASRISRALRNSGFRVEQISNADAARLKAAMDNFHSIAARAGPSDELIFYFSGHSVQIEEALYLIPVAATLINDPRRGQSGPAYLYRDRAAGPLVPVTRLRPPDRPSSATGYNLIFLDSCRGNPWPDLAIRGIPVRNSPQPVPSGGKAGGLASRYMPAAGSGFPARPHGTILALAAAPGSDAFGEIDSSPFTDALLQYLGGPSDLMRILFRAGKRVSDETGGEQKPHFYFDPPTNPCFQGCPSEERGAFAANWITGAPQDAVQAARRATLAAANAESSAAALKATKPLEFELHYFGMQIVGGPEKPPPAIVHAENAIATYNVYEDHEIQYAGHFSNGVPDGGGVLDFNCAVVFLRARCPLHTYQLYRGLVSAGTPGGPGMLLDLVSGRQDFGDFAPVAREKDSPISEKPPALVLGIASYPDGRMEIGRFEGGELSEGLKIGQYRSGVVQISHH